MAYHTYIVAHVTEAFGSDQLYIIDMSQNNEITTLNPGNATNQLIVDENNDVWVGCGGGNSGDPDFAPNNDGRLVKIDSETDAISTTIDLNTNFAGKIAVNDAKDEIYFYVGNSVFAIGINATSGSSDALFTVSDSFGFYGIRVDPDTGNVFVADAKDFVQDGEVYIYSEDGSMINSITVGRIPNGFLFN